jgi:hypothetical protein
VLSTAAYALIAEVDYVAPRYSADDLGHVKTRFIFDCEASCQIVTDFVPVPLRFPV